MDYSNMSPQEVKKLIRTGEIDYQTSGMCNGYAQANLCILPKDYAFDFLLFCMIGSIAAVLLMQTAYQTVPVSEWPFRKEIRSFSASVRTTILLSQWILPLLWHLFQTHPTIHLDFVQICSTTQIIVISVALSTPFFDFFSDFFLLFEE